MKTTRDRTPQELATFDDRWTMRHVRVYPHPIERVWEAVSTAEHLDAWMMPKWEVERRVGGRYSCTFGGNVASEGVIIEFDPPRVIDYDGMRFELEPVAEGTRLTFIQSFDPGSRNEPVEDQPGGDLPGGPDTPWRTGFVAGFHGALDNLGAWLAGDVTGEQTKERSAAHRRGEHDPRWLELVEAYREHIRRTIPPA
jgi:uncharacterized protein YndB with AHSA1/START domain